MVFFVNAEVEKLTLFCEVALMKNCQACYSSVIGLIEVRGSEEGILSVSFVDEFRAYPSDAHPCVQECVEQVDEYFRGLRQQFTIPTVLRGTEFQRQVWNALQTIPFGQMASYLDVAALIGKTNAACRAVGQANMNNRIAMLVPCHRVVGSDGTLTGYAGGVWRKSWLLRHEGATLL